MYWVGFILSALDCSVFLLSQGFSLPPPPPLSFLPFSPPLCLDPVSISAALLMQRWFLLLPGQELGCSCSGGALCRSALLPAPGAPVGTHGAQRSLCVCVRAHACIHVHARTLNLFLSQQAVLCTGEQRRLLLQGLLYKSGNSAYLSVFIIFPLLGTA